MRNWIIAGSALLGSAALLAAAYVWPTDDHPTAPYQCWFRLCVASQWASTVSFGTDAGTFDINGNKLPKWKGTPTLPLVSVTIPDSVGQLSRKAMTTICSRSSCLAYHKFCSDVGCSYVISQPNANDAARDRHPIIWGYAMFIAADTADEIHRIESSVWLVASPHDRSPPEYVLLRRLDKASANSDVPNCGREDPGCPPSHYN